MSAPAKSEKRANSRRRPSRVASAISGIVVIGEEPERPLLAVLLAHEEQRHLRREQERGGAHPKLFGGGPVAERPVAHLVVVLRAERPVAPRGGGRTARRAPRPTADSRA